MADNKLEEFKIGVNLSEFAASRGYVLDKRESCLQQRFLPK
jgi:hypothetical protein